jgi:hypothetical protein
MIGSNRRAEESYATWRTSLSHNSAFVKDPLIANQLSDFMKMIFHIFRCIFEYSCRACSNDTFSPFSWRIYLQYINGFCWKLVELRTIVCNATGGEGAKAFCR